MLDDNEFKIAQELYQKGFRALSGSMKERFDPLLDWYFKYTGYKMTIPNAIMHHQLSLYGPPCENCGKPYRTEKATFCASCGNRRSFT